MFLENSINQLTKKPVWQDDEIVDWLPANELYKPKLIPWVQFKQLIFQIYDHRISNSEEIDGAINNTYMSFDEHLIIYMLEMNKTRVKTEIALIDFLSQLKYFAD